MKRLLSILLALSLVISIIPAAFAAEGETAAEQKLFSVDVSSHQNGFLISSTEGAVVTTAYREVNGTPYYINPIYYDDYNGRNWKLFDISDAILAANGTASNFALRYANATNEGSYFQVACGSSNLNLNLNVALTLKATQTGFYIPKLKFYNGSYSKSPTLDWYITDAADYTGTVDYTDTVKGYKNPENNILTVTSMTADTETRQAGKLIYTQSGKELVTAFGGGKQVYRFYDITLTEVQNPKIEITVDKTELNTTDNTTALITSTTVKGDNQTTAMPVAGGFIEYVVEQEGEFITFDEATGTITAVAAGEAHITAQSPDGLVKSTPITVTVTAPSAEPDETQNLTNAFAHESTTENAATIPDEGVTVNTYVYTVDGTKKNLDKSEKVTAGTAYEVDADKITGMDGYEFLYWAKGATMDKKQIVSGNAKYSFIPTVEATHLIAVFAPKTAGATAKAEFYNGNGQLLPDYTVTSGDAVTIPELPSMAGYGDATHWELYGDTTEYEEGDSVALSGTMIFVAQYDELEADININVTGGSCDKTEYKYGDVVTCTPGETENFIGWKKDGVIVSMDTEYTFNAWEDCDVEAVYGEHSFNGPATKLLIDIFNDKLIMAEFIGLSNYGDVVEKGIMIGNKRFAMQKPLATQFTLEADNAAEAATAVAYAIFDNGTMITDK